MYPSRGMHSTRPTSFFLSISPTPSDSKENQEEMFDDSLEMPPPPRPAPRTVLGSRTVTKPTSSMENLSYLKDEPRSWETMSEQGDYRQTPRCGGMTFFVSTSPLRQSNRGSKRDLTKCFPKEVTYDVLPDIKPEPCMKEEIPDEDHNLNLLLSHILAPNNDQPISEFLATLKIPHGSTMNLDIKCEVRQLLDKDDMALRAVISHQPGEHLREKAIAFFRSKEIEAINKRIVKDVQNEVVIIRPDRNIQSDFGAQKHIKQLLFSYNPFWLRLGLETLTGINLESCSQESLLRCIETHFFISPELQKKYGHPHIKNHFKSNAGPVLKKHILKNFLILINFLDAAKSKHLVSTSPPLFKAKANIKNTSEIIASFSREYITGVGSILKHLKSFGFSLDWKQPPIDEFDMTVRDYRIDFRCGIRLTRLVELIFHQKGLSSLLMAPVVNKTRKQHNVKVALDAIKKHDPNCVPDNLTVNHIVDGDLPKTKNLLCSLLFNQEFYKAKKGITLVQKRLQAKLAQKRWIAANRDRINQMNHAATVIQKNYRAKKQHQKYLKIRASIVKVQRWWRCVLSAKQQRTEFLALKKSVICLQSAYRSRKQRREFIAVRRSTMKIQIWWRNVLQVRVQREEYLKMRAFAIKIQSLYRARRERSKFLQLKSSAITIQVWWRSLQLAQKDRAQFILIKKSVIKIQSYCRGHMARQNYLSVRNSSSKIQTWWRGVSLTKMEREKFLKMRNAAIKLQSAYRGRKQRKAYLELCSSALLLQNRWRSYLLMKAQRKEYLKIRDSVILIQSLYRCRKERHRYSRLRSSTIKIQAWWRATSIMKVERAKYLKSKSSAIKIQSTYRGYKQRTRFLLICSSASKIQVWWRSILAMKSERARYNKLKESAIVIQSVFRGYKQRQENKRMAMSALIIQKRWRAMIAMKKQRQEYLCMKKSAIKIQAFYRGQKQRQAYLTMQNSAVKIQNWWRSLLIMRAQRHEFLMMKKAAIKIQSLYRRHKDRTRYMELQKVTLFMQRAYRAKAERKKFLALRKSALFVQSHYRGKRERTAYLHIKRAVRIIQRSYRQYRFRKELLLQSPNSSTHRASLIVLAPEEKRLGSKTRTAINKLLSYRYVSQIVHELGILDKSTSYLPELCLEFANTTEAIKILTKLVHESTRSPHDRVYLGIAFEILLNLTKYDKSRVKVAEHQPLMRELVDQARVHFKDQEMFCKITTIIYLLLKQNKVKETTSKQKILMNSLSKLTQLAIDDEKRSRAPNMKSPIGGPKFSPRWCLIKDAKEQFPNRFIAMKNIMHSLGCWPPK